MSFSLNSDLCVGTDDFHVQTEDWGQETQFIVTRIYKNGAVLKSIKTPYFDILAAPMWDQQAIGAAVEDQHHKILDLVLSGQSV